MLHWFGPVFPIDFIYSIINLLTTIIIISLLCVRYKINNNIFLILIFTLISPFLVNGPLMEWTSLPDQSKYLKDTLLIRDFEFSKVDGRRSIYIPSAIFALTPLPFIHSFNDIGIANRLLLSLLIIFLIKKKTPNLFIYYILLSPSLLLYSSTALKETVVLILSTMTFYAIVKKKYLFFFFPYVFLLACKKQNGLVMLPLYFFHLFYFNVNFKFKRLFGIIIISIFLFLVFFFDDFILKHINYYRFTFFTEDSGLNFEGFTSIGNLLIQLPYDLLKFLISPFPDLNSPIKILFFFDSLFIVSLLIIYFVKIFKIDIKQFLYWIISFSLFLSMYSLTVFNHGTISRYKISFIIPILFIIIYLVKNIKKK